MPLQLVEGVEVTRGTHDQLFDLPLADFGPAVVPNQLDDFGERAPRAPSVAAELVSNPVPRDHFATLVS